jgi:hypothetical protein
VDGARDSEIEQRVRLIVALLSLAYTIWITWSLMVPQHRRQLLRMRLLLLSRTAADRAARLAGAAAMRAELATGSRNYALPYTLSRTREWLKTAYDKTRSIDSS